MSFEVCTFGESYLCFIEYEIKQNFKVDSPAFIFNFNKFYCRKEVIYWIDDILEKDRVVRYRFLRDNVFELKDFSPDPSDEACENLIEEFLNSSYKIYGSSDLFFQVVDFEDSKYFFEVVNNKKEARRELLYSMRQGRSRIVSFDDFFSDLKPPGDRKIVMISVEDESELGREFDNNFVTFENKY